MWPEAPPPKARMTTNLTDSPSGPRMVLLVGWRGSCGPECGEARVNDRRQGRVLLLRRLVPSAKTALLRSRTMSRKVNFIKPFMAHHLCAVGIHVGHARLQIFSL